MASFHETGIAFIEFHFFAQQCLFAHRHIRKSFFRKRWGRMDKIRKALIVKLFDPVRADERKGVIIGLC